MANDPYAALRFREFRLLIGGTFINTVGLLVQQVALAYELYRITRDPLVLGLIGLAEAIPFMALALFGGHLADRREKRRLMQASLAVIISGSLVLIWATAESTRQWLPQSAMLWIIYSVIALIGLARGIYSPASSSLKPFLVPREHYGNSSTWSSMFWQAGAILGPVSAGLLYAGLGLTGTLIVATLMFVANSVMLGGIAPRAVVVADAAEDLWTSLREGIAYVRKTKIILYAISLDMFSVLFGGVMAILPVFAEDVLRTGPEGLGGLRAAPAVGALVTIVFCAYYPPLQRAWRNMLLSVAGFGVATLVFALSEIYWLSIVALVLTGAFDSISVIVRSTILQALPPEHLRGRVISVNSIFVSASNELGAFESGLAARLMGAVPSVVFGGAVTLATVGWVWRRSRDLLTVKIV